LGEFYIRYHPWNAAKGKTLDDFIGEFNNLDKVREDPKSSIKEATMPKENKLPLFQEVTPGSQHGYCTRMDHPNTQEVGLVFIL